jgi:hypothetical protein
VTPTEQIAKSASTPKTGRFATLRARLRAFGGSGAPKIAPLVLILAVAAGMAFSAPALAAVEHTKTGEFTGAETPAKSFGSASGVAVDATTGDVYVADVAHNVVDRFDASGKYLSQLTGAETPATTFALSSPAEMAVDDSTVAGDPSRGDVYVLDAGNGAIDKFASASAAVPGKYLGQVGGPYLAALNGVAVDGRGDVWVYDAEVVEGAYPYDTEGNVHEFDSSGHAVFQFATGSFISEPGLAVDANGDPYTMLQVSAEKFTGSGERLFQVGECAKDAFHCAAMGTDLSTGELYIDEGAEGAGIAEYGPAGELLVRFGAAQRGQGGIAVNPVSGNVYVSNSGSGKVYVYGPTAGPRVMPLAASGVQATSATVNATVNPRGVDTSYRFEYGPSTEYGQSVPASAVDVGAGTSPVAASGELTGLETSTTYHYRVVATDANGNVTRGADLTFTTLTQPQIASVSVTGLGATSAVLNARVNPRGLPVTSCSFEYGTDTSYGLSAACVPGASGIPVDSSEHTISASIGKLHEDRTYHWRLEVGDQNGVNTGVDHTFVYSTTGGGLPDNRQYEMVTPPQKNGALFGAGTLVSSPGIAADGSRVIAPAVQCLGDAASCTAIYQGRAGTSYMFTRTSSGWGTSSLAQPEAQFRTGALDESNANTGIAQYLVPVEPFGEDDIYLREPDGSFFDVGPLRPPSQGKNSAVDRLALPNMYAYTEDFSHVAWTAGTKIWPEFDGTTKRYDAGTSVYEYVGADNSRPLLVGVSGGQGSHDLISTCGTMLGDQGHSAGYMSADGRTVYVTVLGSDHFPGQAGCFGTGSNEKVEVPVNELFARVDGEASDAHTVAISQRSPTECTGECLTSPPSSALFVDGSADGAKAFFVSTQQLTNSASEDSIDTLYNSSSSDECGKTLGPNGCNLYEYDFDNPAGHNLLDVSAGDTSGHGPRVMGVMAASPDGSHVYFVARGVLSSGANRQGQVARDGADNLYLYERDATYPAGRVVFIASRTKMSYSETAEWTTFGIPDDQANVAPDGRFVVFRSSGRLTADDTSVSGAQQVFRYDAVTGELVRISVGNDGFNDNGNRSSSKASPCIGGESNWGCENAMMVPAAAGARRDPTMSDDGSYVFFESPVGLTPQALDDVPVGVTEGGEQVVLAQNVYEWHAGHVYLISDGRDVTRDASGQGNTVCLESESSVCLLGSDTTGANVFFSTTDQLVAQDTDTELDYYDARVCTAESPCIKQAPAPLPPCLGEVCHGTPAGTPGVPAAPSVTFNGAGNLAGGRGPNPPPVVKKKTVKCKRGLVKNKKGKCVKKKKAKRATNHRRAKP